MRAAADLADYLRRPIGQYLSGPTFIVWWLNPGLNGIVFWGRPEPEHVRTVTLALEAEMAPGVGSHGSVIDARYIEMIGLGAFNTMAQYLATRREQFARLVTRQAVLRPDGLAGAAVAGFHTVLASPFPSKVFTDTVLAISWLGIESDAGVIEETNQLRSKILGESPFVSSLRHHLERKLHTTLKDIAPAMGLSPRDLQRKLRDANTRFKIEQNAARIRVATILLLDSQNDLKQIAAEVGCASAQHFSALFRRMVGETPRSWRARNLAREAG